ncbi:protease inhibitor I9 family protein [Lentzea sp. NPDC055074]
MREKIMRVVACAAAVADRYIVVFKGEADVKSSAMVARYGGSVRKFYDKVVDGYSATMSAAQAARLAKDPKVSYVQQVNRMSTMDSQTPTPNWGVDRID